jgi:hypothetical protein
MTDEEAVHLLEYGTATEKADSFVLLLQRGQKSFLRLYGRDWEAKDVLALKTNSVYNRKSLAYPILVPDEKENETELLRVMKGRNFQVSGFPIAVVDYLREIALRPGEWDARSILWRLGFKLFLSLSIEEQKIALSEWRPESFQDLFSSLDQVDTQVRDFCAQLCLDKEIPDNVRAAYQTALHVDSDDLIEISGSYLLYEQANYGSKAAYDRLVQLSETDAEATLALYRHLEASYEARFKGRPYPSDLDTRIYRMLESTVSTWKKWEHLRQRFRGYNGK